MLTCAKSVRMNANWLRPAALGALVLVSAGCDYRGAQSLPLPGGAAKGPTYELTIVFDDASDLVPMDSVRSGAVPIGDVASIRLGPDMLAHLVLRCMRAVHLPRNVEASFAEWPLDEPAVPPERWVLFHAEQYAQAGFPFAPFTRASVCRWVCFRQAGTGMPWWAGSGSGVRQPRQSTTASARS